MDVLVILEAALISAGKPLSMAELAALFPEEELPDKTQIDTALTQLRQNCQGRGLELREVAGGYRLQVQDTLAPWMARLHHPAKTHQSKAFMETLAIIAYRQPITRKEIEVIRGVQANQEVLKKLQDQGWVKIVGHRSAPGHPALYGTTKRFLEDFNLNTLNDLPALASLGNPSIL